MGWEVQEVFTSMQGYCLSGLSLTQSVDAEALEELFFLQSLHFLLLLVTLLLHGRCGFLQQALVGGLSGHLLVQISLNVFVVVLVVALAHSAVLVLASGLRVELSSHKCTRRSSGFSLSLAFL